MRPGKAVSSDGALPRRPRSPQLACGSRWEPGRPVAKSLWLLPSDPDQVGDDHARPTPEAHMGESGDGIKN